MTDDVDAMVAAFDPSLGSFDVQARDVVLVTGPWLAGTTILTAALGKAMPEHTFVEADEIGAADAPAAVVFAVSAIAPLTESDCALLDLATVHTDLVLGVVTKIDAHRNWRDVLAADRALLSERAPRYHHTPWVGVAAAPDLGEPCIDELVGVLRQRLADPDMPRRNRLRAWEFRLDSAIMRDRSEGEGSDRAARVTTLRTTREDILRARRQAKSECTIALRSQVQQARLQLSHFARNRCSSMRSELQEDASQLGRRGLSTFEPQVRARAEAVAEEVEEGVTAHLRDTAAVLTLPVPPLPPPSRPPQIASPTLRSRRLETRLTMILGAGFGLGVALAVTRLFAGLAPGLTVVGLVAGGLVGLALTVWVVGVRGLLHHRAALDRWVGEVATALRSALEERVASRVLAAETALTSVLAARDDAESASAAHRVAEIDAELRQHAVDTARAAAVRDRRLPALSAAVGAVRKELYGGRGGQAAEKSDVTN